MMNMRAIMVRNGSEMSPTIRCNIYSMVSPTPVVEKRDTWVVTIPCLIRLLDIKLALYDLGESIIVIRLVIYMMLGLG